LPRILRFIAAAFRAMPNPPSARNETEPVVIRGADFPGHTLHGEGTIRRAIYPDLTGSARLFVGLAEFGPGQAPHVFHNHGTEVVGAAGRRRRLTYAEDFEEFYFVVEGSGEMQWRFADGSARAVTVEAGDAVYFPPGVVEHRIFNSGTSRMRVLYGGTPPASVETLD
jgi:oxalate decarboxylase/phosphoglucose isomerase-like protein (cupin superfamily)